MKANSILYYAYLTDFLKLWLVLWGIMKFRLIRNKKVICITFAAQILIVFVAGFYNRSFPDEVMFTRVFLVIAAYSFLFQGRFFKKLAYSLLAYLLVLFLDTSTLGICSLYANMSGHEFSGNSTITLINNSINIFTIGTFVLIKKRKNKTETIVISKRIYALLFAGAATGVITIAALLVGSNDSVTESARIIMIVVTIVAAICYNAACLMIIIITESRDNYKALSLINQNIIESQQKYYTLVNEKQQEMRSIRHEMKNHLACIHGLYKADKQQEMEQYINQLIETSDTSLELFDTGNDIVNAILNDAQSKYKKDNIIIRLEGGFPNELNVAPMDLCVIFANLVSNAIEAILRMERVNLPVGYIDIRINSFKDDLYINIENPAGIDTEFEIGKFTTSKADKRFHGFGVRNVIQRVEKYHGTVNFKYENNHFSVGINLKNKA